MKSTKKALFARVSGRVQGVGFRAWTRNEAKMLGLTGWVRNEADGTVTALLCGSPEAVDAMTIRLQDGPPSAEVVGIRTEPATPGEVFPDFRIRS